MTSLNVLPLPTTSTQWVVNQVNVPREFKAIVDFSVKLTINNIPRLKKSTCNVNIHFVSISRIHFLNRYYRNSDKHTNVLSFPCDAIEGDELIGAPRELGDIFVCLKVIEEESEVYGKPLLHHLVHMMVHASLHLAGYDHEQASDARRMREKEVHILGIIGIDDPYKDES